VIATALTTIKMPDVDFEQLAKILVDKYPDDIIFDGKKVSSDKPC
jgi:hypothetical protein